jgi:EAL domain-containing protein (putative c-di-GMP-specific phosphodiesterase class I)
MLKAIGVNYAQGYGICKPISFESLLKQSNNVHAINQTAQSNER